MSDAGVAVIAAAELEQLIARLAGRGYRVIGPTLRDDAIVYDQISGVRDLPSGWTDVQQPGTYRLERRRDQALFGFAVGPHSWKRFLHPQRVRLWQAGREGDHVKVIREPESQEKLAFLGVRACELHAMDIQDKVFVESAYPDRGYAQRRAGLMVIAVNCSVAGGTCFCSSMDAGPEATDGFDLALTEILDDDGHRFLAAPGSERGRDLLHDLDHRPALAEDLRAAREVVRKTTRNMGRTMDTAGIKSLLQDNPEHTRWDEVADRCLSCANCTMVCPTCFCTTVEDVTDLDGDHTERWRRWDSCFTADFSYIHGGSVRASVRSRYRQWLTHKLAHWIDQFGTSGCVGCGRCITWCPVGIDITEEVAAIRVGGTIGEEPA